MTLAAHWQSALCLRPPFPGCFRIPVMMNPNIASVVQIARTRYS